MSSRWTILVDVGNSAVKVAVVRSRCGSPNAPPNANHAVNASHGAGASHAAGASPGTHSGGQLLRFLRLDLRDAAWPAAVVEQSWQLFGLEGERADESSAARQWVVASVNGPATRLLRDCVASAAAGDAWYELTHHDIAMRAELRNPAAVGIDRLLGASAAWRASASSCPADGFSEAGIPKGGRGVISIDAGSAVTVDLVRDGVFVGGAILPGLRLQMASLTEGTDLLPAVTCEGANPLEIPGRDTVSAMRTGVMLGLSGGIDRLIEKYSEGLASPPHVFLTGGDAATLEPLLRHSVNRRDDLVLSAIADTAPAFGDPVVPERAGVPERARVPENQEGEVC